VGLRQPRWMTELPRVPSPGRRWSPIVGEHEPRDWSAIFRFKQRMASLWVSPAATLVLHEARPRLARMRTWVSAMMCSARLVWRSPPWGQVCSRGAGHLDRGHAGHRSKQRLFTPGSLVVLPHQP
jgi:hypothetical protein